MSLYAEPPLNEFEERWFLAEILKYSPIAPGILLDLIAQGQVEPSWVTIVPPFGRSIAACQNAYSFLTSRRPPNLNSKGKNVGHTFQLGETSSLGERTIQPRPPAFSSTNGRQEQIQSGEHGRPKKKRGRPSKEEHEQRVAEAALRGEIYPPPKKTKTPRPSLDATSAVTLASALETSNEAGPLGALSPATTNEKKPQLKPAFDKNAAEPASGAPADPYLQKTTTTAPTFTPGGPLLAAQPAVTFIPGCTQTAERPVQESTDKGESSGTYKSPFTSEPSHFPSSVPLAEPSYPTTTQH